MNGIDLSKWGEFQPSLGRVFASAIRHAGPVTPMEESACQRLVAPHCVAPVVAGWRVPRSQQRSRSAKERRGTDWRETRESGNEVPIHTGP